jgi:hypothetical protein
MNEVISARDERLSFYQSNINFDEVTREEVKSTIASIADEKVAPLMAQLDSILSQKEDAISLSDVITDGIMFAKENGVKINPNTLDVAIGVAQEALKRVQLDSIGNVTGGEIVASYIKLNIYSVLSANIPFAGDIADLVPVAGTKNNTKFKVYSVEPVVGKAMGEMTEGETINGLTSGDTFAILERHETQVADGSATSFTFNLKAKEGDATNAKMERGVNECVVAGVTFIEDYDVSAKENPAKRVIAVDGNTYTVTFDYNAGTIKLDTTTALASGTKIYFEGSISTDELGSGTGSIKSEIVDYNYIAIPVSIDVVVNALKLRQVLQSVGLNLQANDLTLALMKIAEEVKQLKIKKALALSKDYGNGVDLSTATENTIAGRYKEFLIEVDSAKADIVEKSGLTSNIVLVGGKGLVRLFSGLSTDEAKTNSITSDETSVRFLGYLNGNIPCIYNPKHDTEYPTNGDGYESIFVIGNPVNPTQKVVISGVGLPILPNDDIGADANSNKTVRMMGKLVVSSNKDQRTRELVRRLKVKF